MALVWGLPWRQWQRYLPHAGYERLHVREYHLCVWFLGAAVQWPNLMLAQGYHERHDVRARPHFWRLFLRMHRWQPPYF